MIVSRFKILKKHNSVLFIGIFFIFAKTTLLFHQKLNHEKFNNFYYDYVSLIFVVYE